MKNLKIFTTIKQKIAKQKIWQKKWVRITFWSLVAAFCIGVASLIGLYFAVAQELPSVVNLEDRQVAESTQIYDRTGEVLLYEISGEENRTIIGEDQIIISILHRLKSDTGKDLDSIRDLIMLSVGASVAKRQRIDIREMHDGIRLLFCQT